MIVIADRVFETSTTQGTGDILLAGPPTGFQSFVAGIGGGNQTYYHIDDGADWESGIGTMTAGDPDTLSRDEVLASSNAGAAVDWGAGVRNVRQVNISAAMATLRANQTFSGDVSFTGGLEIPDNTVETDDIVDEAVSYNKVSPDIKDAIDLAETALQPSDRNIIQIVEVDMGTASTTANDFGSDDTVPLVTEGGQLWTGSITPVSDTSKIYIIGTFHLSITAGGYMAAALFNEGGTCLYAKSSGQIPSNNATRHVVFSVLAADSPGSTEEQTYQLRGSRLEGSGGTVLLGDSTAARFGDAANAGKILIMEVKQ